MKDTLDKIQHLAGCIRQDIGHIRNGANVTSEELWSANESLDELFKVLVQAKKDNEISEEIVQIMTETNLRPHECKHPAWTKESPLNNWRSTCKVCGVGAAGSCQG